VSRPRKSPLPDVGTREKILKSAASLFHRRGFEATGMSDIANAVGIQKSSLYHHFESKQKLLFEILSHTVETAIGGTREIASSHLPAPERLRMAIRNHIVNLVDDLDNVACFVEEGKALEPPYREEYLRKRDAYEGEFRRILEEGIASGEFRKTDVRLAGFAVLGMCNWVVRWYHPEGPHTPDEIASSLAEVAVLGLMA
jgi:AcrR family transcriptional regulator